MKPHVGIMSPGHMGQAVAEQLKNNGFAVYTALEKRSARTRALATEAGITDVGSIAALTQRCDVILSIVPSDQALPLASEVAQALHDHPHQMIFADCNAIAPGTMREIAEKITRAGGRCIDACILEPPPRGDAEIQVYLAGEHAHELEQLATPQIRMRVVSARMGDASAIKMCLCAANKGRTTLVLSLLIAARRLGVVQEVEAKITERHGAF